MDALAEGCIIGSSKEPRCRGFWCHRFRVSFFSPIYSTLTENAVARPHWTRKIGPATLENPIFRSPVRSPERRCALETISLAHDTIPRMLTGRFGTLKWHSDWRFGPPGEISPWRIHPTFPQEASIVSQDHFLMNTCPSMHHSLLSFSHLSVVSCCCFSLLCPGAPAPCSCRHCMLSCM